MRGESQNYLITKFVFIFAILLAIATPSAASSLA